MLIEETNVWLGKGEEALIKKYKLNRDDIINNALCDIYEDGKTINIEPHYKRVELIRSYAAPHFINAINEINV